VLTVKTRQEIESLPRVADQSRPFPRRELLDRLARRLEALSGGCPQCRILASGLDETLECREPDSTTWKRRIDGMVRHLKSRHGLVLERYYFKRFVTTAAAVGFSLVGLGYLLFTLGVTAVLMAIAVPTLFGRMAVSSLFGLYLDRRARNRGAVI